MPNQDWTLLNTFQRMLQSPRRNRGEEMLLIKTSSSKKKGSGSLTTFSESVGLKRCLLLLALKVNPIETLSGGVWRILKIRNPQMENAGLLVHWSFNPQCWHLHCHAVLQHPERLPTTKEANLITFYELLRPNLCFSLGLLWFSFRLWVHRPKLIITTRIKDQACIHAINHRVWKWHHSMIMLSVLAL